MYGGFFLASFLTCFYLTFPWPAVKQRALQQVTAATGIPVRARSLEPRWITGIHAEEVELELEPGEPFAVQRIDARANVLSFLGGGFGGTVRFPVAGGEVEAELRGTKKESKVVARVERLELAMMPGLRAATDLALAGVVGLDVDVQLAFDTPEKSEGQIRLRAAGLETLDGGKLAGFPVPALEIGDLDWDLPVEEGKLLVSNQRLSGPNVDAVLDGQIVLAKPLSRSLVNLVIRFKPTPAFLQKEPLFASLLKNIDPYKGADGFYGYQISGTLKRPRFTPKRG